MINEERSAREDILGRLRGALRETGPELPERWQATDGVPLGWHDFARALVESHGEFHGPIPRSRLRDFLLQHVGEDFVCSDEAARYVEGGGDTTEREGALWWLGTAHYAIARNGAVAVTAALAPVRREWLLCENQVLLVPADALLQDLDELYQNVRGSAGDYLTLVCGPSKTADIEQTLVTGAHGPRRLVVVAVAERE